MASIGTLYTTDKFINGYRILVVAELAGLKIDIAQNYKHHEDNLTPEYRAKFASGKIPAFEAADGFTMFETTSIVRYVASLAPNSGLLGNSPKEQVLVDQWTTYAENEIGAASGLIHYMIRGLIPYHKPVENNMIERRDKAYATFNNHLAANTYLVGERITVADIQLALIVLPATKWTFDAPTRAKFPHLTRHLLTLVNHPKIKPVLAPLGEVELIEKAVVYTAPAKPKKEEKPKEAPKPKAAEKPKKKDDDDDDDNEEDEIKEEPKPKNPLDLLPKSTFNLEDWKRKYSNFDTRGAGGSLEWFYENYDREGYSIWRVDFKYNEELTQVFMSSNQIGGFFNRLEESRKYLFGSLGVIGEANKSVIAGAFVTRGPEIEATIKVAPDYESYSYQRIDPFNNPADKEFFEAALAWDLEISGKKWADGKVFK